MAIEMIKPRANQSDAEITSGIMARLNQYVVSCRLSRVHMDHGDFDRALAEFQSLGISDGPLVADLIEMRDCRTT